MSRDEVRTPERDLLYAVIVRSIEDLTSKDETIKFDAHEFWFQPKGPWADQRRMFLDAVGFDEDAMIEGVQHLFDPPERPDRKITNWDFYDAMPDYPISASPFGRTLGLTYSKSSSRLQQLMDDGLVKRVDRGKFIRVDKYDAWVASSQPTTPSEIIVSEPMPQSAPVTKPKLDPRPLLIGALKSGPKTVREIFFSLDGDLGMDAIKNHLRKAMNDDLAEYNDPYWTLKTHQDAA